MTLPQQPVSLMGRDPDVLTTAEVATRLGLSAQTVRRMAHARQLPALKTGKDFRYSWTAVKEVLRQPHHEPGGQPTHDTDPHDNIGVSQVAGDRDLRHAEHEATSSQ
jgi:excisionase family DNA binding protein